MIGTSLQNYYIESVLGEGGMGKVYKATDTVLGRVTAIKSLNASLTNQPSFLERFKNEAKILARLSHPNIAVLYNYLQNGSDYYMVMEYVEGENLDQLAKRNKTIPYQAVVPMIIQALEGLAHAHSKGVLHRDIKPANLMLTPSHTIKLMDFGIAKMSDQAKLTQVSRVIGTLEFLAPELIEGQQPSPASDIYAIGVTMYELLTGKLPFTGKSDYMLMQEIVKEKPVLPDNWNASIPLPLAEIVLKALEKKPDDRYKTAEEFSRSLSEAFPGLKQVPDGLLKPAVSTVKVQQPLSEDESDPVLPPSAAPATVLHKELPATTVWGVRNTAAAKPSIQGNPVPVVKNKLFYLAAAVLAVILFTLFQLFSTSSEDPSNDRSAPVTDNTTASEENFNLVDDHSAINKKDDSLLFLLNKKKQEEAPLVVTVENKPGAEGSVSTKKPGEKPSSQTTGLKPGQAETKPRPAPEVVDNGENDPDDVASRGPIALRGRGMPLVIALRENLSKETASEGQQVTFKLLEPGLLRGEVILPKGTVLYGKIKGLGVRRMSIVLTSLEARGRSGRLEGAEIGAGMETVFSGEGFRTSLRGTIIP